MRSVIDDRAALREEIAARRQQVAVIIETIADHQAMLQRLQTERSVIEAELRGLERARKCLERR